MVRLTADYSFHFRIVFDEQQGLYSDPSQPSSEYVTVGVPRFDFDWFKNQIYICGNQLILLYDITSGYDTQLYKFSEPKTCRFVKIDPYSR